MSVVALLNHPAVVFSGGPAEGSTLDAIARRYDAVLPAELVRMWVEGRQIRIDSAGVHFLDPEAVLEAIAPGSWAESFFRLGWLPLLDDHESNYLMLAVRGPLAPRVIWVPHDDDPAVRYRDLNSFAAGLIEALAIRRPACEYFRQTDGDYAAVAQRTVEDRGDAWELLAAPHESDEWNFAAQLLGPEDLDDWARLLETEHFIRRDVLARLRQFSAEPIRRLLARDQAEFNAFVNAVASAARAEGFSVGERNGTCLRVNSRWYELEGFFFRRNIPNAMPRIMLWLADQAAGQNPYDRPGHFMTDG